MDCQNVQLLIQQQLDRTLTPEERALLDAHLAGCADCAAYADSLLSLDALLHSELPEVEPPAGFAASVMSALPQTPVRRQRRLRPLRVAGLAAAAAALLLVAGLAGLFDPDGEQLPVEPQPPVIAEADPQPVTPPATPEVEEQPVEIPPAEEQPIEEQPEQTPEQPAESEEQPVVVEPQPPASYTHQVQLPPVAANNEAQGEYAQIILASYASCDALSPHVSGDIVTYYIQVDGYYYEYQVAADGSSAAQPVAEVAALPAAQGHSAAADNGAGYLAELKADGLYVTYGENTVLVAAQSGGTLLSWSPDGAKLAFSDAAGTLYLYYPAEQLLLTAAANVSSLCWHNSNSLIYAGLDAATGYASIFRSVVP